MPQAVGYALFLAQNGKIHEHAKVLSGMGSAGIQEIRENDKRGTYRVIYTQINSEVGLQTGSKRLKEVKAL